MVDKKEVKVERSEPATPIEKANEGHVRGGFALSLAKCSTPLALTALSFYLRFYNIAANDHVVWDEAHFGKFGSYYLRHEFYHDVHPPLGKMLIGLSEYLAGFDGNFEFESGAKYPDDLDYASMRRFNAVFGSLCTPVAYYTATWMGLSYPTSLLVGLMVALEHSYIALSKFILLDSMLLFFTLTSFACMCKLNSLRHAQLTKEWSLWLLLTGLSLGCVCSVKWVGLFITVIVGLYTVIDLYRHMCDAQLSRLRYYKHWLIRIIYLIAIPCIIYVCCFKVHFALLYKSGTGDSSTNTLFQINLEGTQIQNSPRDLLFGSQFTMRSHGLSPNLLHSHPQLYPDGSRQRQITGYSHFDSNNVWEFNFVRKQKYDPNKMYLITDGVEVRLVHNNTRSNLHSHEVPSHVSRGNYEVSGYGHGAQGDDKDNWVIEIVDQLHSANPDFPEEDANILHPVSTFFRLRHKILGCYLTSTGMSYPQWGFSQAEIVCKNSWSKRDKSTWWNIEEHWNPKLKIAEDYVPPKSKFWTDFVLINFAMASSNNALVPDPDKYDSIASSAWEWPTLHTGLRMCTWSRDTTRYYLMGSPFNTWISTLSILVYFFVMARIAYKWRRQTLTLTEDDFWALLIQGVMPFLAWMTHYLPFALMGRVTYVHHYVPALYFAILIFGFVVEYMFASAKIHVKYPAYLALFGGCIYVYVLFAPMCQGLTGLGSNYLKLQWLPTWDIVI